MSAHLFLCLVKFDALVNFILQKLHLNSSSHSVFCGICGSCSLYINGEAHGPDRAVTTCQLHMRKFKDGETIFLDADEKPYLPIIQN